MITPSVQLSSFLLTFPMFTKHCAVHSLPNYTRKADGRYGINIWKILINHHTETQEMLWEFLIHICMLFWNCIASWDNMTRHWLPWFIQVAISAWLRMDWTLYQKERRTERDRERQSERESRVNKKEKESNRQTSRQTGKNWQTNWGREIETKIYGV